MHATQRPLASGARASAGAMPLLPSLCAVCRGWGRGRVCAACLERHRRSVPRCRRCALALPSADADVCGACLRDPPPFDFACAAVDYEAPWDRLVTDFKFHAALDLAPVMARAIADAWCARRDDDAVSTPDLLLPVPLAATRWRERGYNQAWEIARRLSRRLGIAADPTLALRLRDTSHQLDLPPDKRAGNVRGAFAVEPRRRGEVAGRRVAIVDDVMTTGSTAGELARELRRAGAASVGLLVFARTPPRGDG